nr:MAG TPA: Putative helicase [Caudoviricetes sp.]
MILCAMLHDIEHLLEPTPRSLWSPLLLYLLLNYQLL